MLYVFRITGIYVKDLGQMGRADIVYMQDWVSQGLIQTRDKKPLKVVWPDCKAATKLEKFHREQT